MRWLTKNTITYSSVARVRAKGKEEPREKARDDVKIPEDVTGKS